MTNASWSDSETCLGLTTPPPPLANALRLREGLQQALPSGWLAEARALEEMSSDHLREELTARGSWREPGRAGAANDDNFYRVVPRHELAAEGERMIAAEIGHNHGKPHPFDSPRSKAVNMTYGAPAMIYCHGPCALVTVPGAEVRRIAGKNRAFKWRFGEAASPPPPGVVIRDAYARGSDSAVFVFVPPEGIRGRVEHFRGAQALVDARAERLDPAWRAEAESILSLAGVGFVGGRQDFADLPEPERRFADVQLVAGGGRGGGGVGDAELLRLMWRHSIVMEAPLPTLREQLLFLLDSVNPMLLDTADEWHSAARRVLESDPFRPPPPPPPLPPLP